MKQYIITSVLLLTFGITTMAQKIDSVDVRVELRHDGSAIITQYWDATVVDGTEWYIPIENLDKMYVDSLTVEENGKPYISEGDKWKVKRSLEEKKGRCGIVRKKKNAVELCWGQGSYERHQWTARFHVSGLVQGFKDYDGFNYMFVNPEMVAGPRRARVVIENHADTTTWTSENTKVWAFGFYGDIHVEDGKIVAKNSHGVGMSRDSKIIVMVRFDKGMFSPTVTRNKSFDKMKKKAFKDSDYNEDGTPMSEFEKLSWWEKLCMFGFAIGFVLFTIILPIYGFIRYILGYRYEKNLFGLSKITEWYRGVPLEGNLLAAFTVLRNGMTNGAQVTHDIVGAFFLKWILDGIITPEPQDKKTINLKFGKDRPLPDQMSPAEMELYDMAREACGDNLLLEKNEFKKYSKKKASKITKWPDEAEKEGKRFLQLKGYMEENGKKATEAGKEELRHVIEMRNFLKDFTKIDERTVMETILWKEYLVYAQLFGIADKVSKQLAKLFPAEMEQFTQSLGTDSTVLMRTISYNHTMTTSAVLNAISRSGGGSSRSGGGGGSSSFGGGGGFSGGGCGGGSR